jgi:hypothetical protein
MSGHGRYAEAGTDLKARAFGKSYDSGCRKVGVLLGCSRRALVPGEIDPYAIAHGKVLDVVPYRVDHAGTVLVRCHLWEWRGCTSARAKTRLPIGGIDARHGNADADLVRTGLGQFSINDLKDRWITGAGVNNGLHAGDALIIFRIIPGPDAALAGDVEYRVDLTTVEAVEQPTSLLGRHSGELYAPTTSLVLDLRHDR